MTPDGSPVVGIGGILAGAPADAIPRRSISLGALVASRPGAVPAWEPAELAAVEALPRRPA